MRQHNQMYVDRNARRQYPHPIRVAAGEYSTSDLLARGYQYIYFGVMINDDPAAVKEILPGDTISISLSDEPVTERWVCILS